MSSKTPVTSGSSDQASPAAGYSGTPQRKKLGIRAGSTLLLWHQPDGWAFADPIDDATLLPPEADDPSIDTILAFVRTPEDLAAVAATLPQRIFPEGILWIGWPRKAAGHVSDVTEQMLRDVLLPIGIVDTKVAAIDHDWSGLKFVWRKDLRQTPIPVPAPDAGDERR
ncbi:MAG: hypothetical protein QM753_09030 [Thermomicrobiales bacterium]